MNKENLKLILGLGFLISAFILGLLGVIKYFQDEIIEIKANQNPIKTDTVYITKVINLPEPFPVILNPTTIEIYKTDTVSKYNTFSLREKDLVLSTPDLMDSVLISKTYLNTFILSPKLLHIGLTKNQFNFSIMNIDGSTQRRIHPIDLDNWNYQFVNGTFSSKKITKFKLEPNLSYMYRPLNNLHDMELSLNFKTSRIYYKLGVNGFYYPNLRKLPGYDISLGITYNFK